MKRRNKPKYLKRIAAKKNLSEMFGEFAHDYISQGSNIDEARNYLNFACIAWNLSLHQKNERKDKLNLVANEYEKLNPEYINSKQGRFFRFSCSTF